MEMLKGITEARDEIATVPFEESKKLIEQILLLLSQSSNPITYCRHLHINNLAIKDPLKGKIIPNEREKTCNKNDEVKKAI